MGEISDVCVVLVRKPGLGWEHKDDLEEIGWEGVDIHLAQLAELAALCELPTGAFSWRAVFYGI